MKYIGAFLIFAACAGTGLWRAYEMRRKVRTLFGIIAALELMKGEICSRLSDLPTALTATGMAAGKELKPFFAMLTAESESIGDRPFAQIWRECALKALPCLDESEMNALLALGAILGRYDAATQSAAFDACMENLRPAYARAAGESGAFVRTSVGAGAAMGAMIAITLL